MRYFLFTIILLLVFSFLFSKLSYALNKGEIYNKEAQNIVNTSDLIIKAEHAYSQNIGGFTGLSNLEREDPPYLSPLTIYDYNNDECAKKILLRSYVYICISPQTAELNVFIANNIASFNMVVQEISKGITGDAGQISYYNGLANISFNLNNDPPSFASNPNKASKVSSIVTSPNANGGTSYMNVGNGSDNNIITHMISVVAGFFASVLSLF